MEIFRDLRFRGEPERIEAAVEAIRQSLTDGWTRNAEAEERLRETAIGQEAYHAFTCTATDRHPAATVFLLHKEPRAANVPNILPSERGRLSHRDYNAILEEFFERFARPCAERNGVMAELTPGQVDLEHWMSPQAAEKLRRFSRSANKSSAASHPSDRERWMDFLVAVHRENSGLAAATLIRWLEESDWPSEIAYRLSSEYESGRELLAFADRRRSA